MMTEHSRIISFLWKYESLGQSERIVAWCWCIQHVIWMIPGYWLGRNGGKLPPKRDLENLRFMSAESEMYSLVSKTTCIQSVVRR